MKKIKIQKNNDIIAFDFYSKLLINNRLSNLCKVFLLEDLYMSIYMIDSRKGDLYKTLIDKKLISQISYVSKKHLQDIHIKLTINELPTITQLLSNFDFDELLIWDCYTDWDTYLKNETSVPPFFTIKSTNIKVENKFFLNYNLVESDKVEIVCDVRYGNKKLENKLSELI